MPRTNRRTSLLRAAAAIVHRDGADALTLDAVAAEARVSKGGLLYHFDSKEALVAGLVEALVEQFDAQLGEPGAAEPGTFSRAYLEVTARGDAEALALSSALLAAAAIAPGTIEPLRARYRRWNRRLRDDGIDEVDAFIVRLAADGLWLADLLGLEPPGPRLRKAIVERLLDRIRAAAERA